MKFSKQLGGAIPSSKYKATEEDYEAIRKHVSDSVDVTKFGVYECVASSTSPDSDGDVFGENVLKGLAHYYEEGRTVVLGSHARDSGVGKTFGAYVKSDTAGTQQLMVKFYIPPEATTQSGGNAKALVDSGVYARTSIMAFWTQDPKPESKTVSGKDVKVYNSTEGMQVLHIAVLDMGANYDAVMKSLFGTPQSVPGGGPNLPPNSKSTGQIMNYVIKSLGLSWQKDNIEHADVIAMLKQAEDESVKLVEKANAEAAKVLALQKEIEPLRAFKEGELNTLKEKYANLYKQANPEAKADAIEKRVALYTAESMSLLREDVEALAKAVSKAKSRQTNLAGKGEEKVSDTTGFLHNIK